MSPKEADVIIAKYMVIDISRCGNYLWLPDDNFDDLYSDSLDSLVPVWEKMAKANDAIYDNWFILDKLSLGVYNEDFDLSIQEAAAIATAKAILGLDKT